MNSGWERHKPVYFYFGGRIDRIVDELDSFIYSSTKFECLLCVKQLLSVLGIEK